MGQRTFLDEQSREYETSHERQVEVFPGELEIRLAVENISRFRTNS